MSEGSESSLHGSHVLFRSFARGLGEFLGPIRLVRVYLEFISGLAKKTNDGEDRAANQGSSYEPGQAP